VARNRLSRQVLEEGYRLPDTYATWSDRVAEESRIELIRREIGCSRISDGFFRLQRGGPASAELSRRRD